MSQKKDVFVSSGSQSKTNLSCSRAPEKREACEKAIGPVLQPRGRMGPKINGRLSALSFNEFDIIMALVMLECSGFFCFFATLLIPKVESRHVRQHLRKM
ncbi:MAG TPA: hypothetical protein ENJ23_00175 [Bacteroidetes bacterium]|nr:hypothetical protein [Bacteroidota bacterium]